MFCRLVAPLVLIVFAWPGMAGAQNPFPAPLPGPQADPPVATWSAPLANGSAPNTGTLYLRLPPSPSREPLPKSTVDLFNRRAVDMAQTPSYPIRNFTYAPPDEQVFPGECANEYHALREEAERRGRLIREASDRHASLGESCKLLGDFRAAEVRMIKYVQLKSAECGIPPDILDQLKAGHKNTEQMQQRACADAATRARWPEGTVTTDFGDPAFKQR
jgi:hypothetical protein